MSTVVNAFLKQAELHPDAAAVLDLQGVMTYGRMNHLSAFLAERILERIGGKGRRARIALLLPRTKDFIVFQFAVLRAGCAVVPVDAEYPRERVQSILEDVGCALCLTTAALAEKAAGFPTLLPESVQPGGEEPEEDITLDLSDPDAEGYILYTSGSTGKPKGVVHRQEMLNCPVETLSGVIPLNEHSRSLNIAGFSFIAGLVDIMPLLAAGGSVYVANEEERKNTDLIHTIFRKRQITGMYCPPQMYTVLKKLYGPLPLEYVLMIGEKYNGEEEEQPGVWEGYGASEACPPVLLNPAGKGGPLCLGKPAARTKVYVVDEEGNRIDRPGEIGELCISSPWLALGYHNMPRETAERFTENPFEPGTRLYHSGDQMAWDENGNLVFHGRRDRMVKIRGYRVELGEIDQVMRGREGIDEAASVDVRVHGGDLICCYYTGEEISPETLKRYAGTYLPDYMVPAYFVHLDSMPRNDRNKVDYPALKALEIRTDEAKYEAPGTETEKKVCAAFEAALDLKKVSAAADFFDCGGTSLSAAVLISRLKGDGFSLAFRDVSAHSTPRELAAFLDAKQDAAIPGMNREIYPLTRTQMGIYLESQTGGTRETYTLPYMIRADRSVRAEDLVQAVSRTLEAHPGLKYIIRTDENGMPGMVPVPEAKIEVPVFEGTEEDRMKFMREFMPVVPMMEKILIHPAVYKTPERCYLIIKTHLIFFDASAISLFIAELNRVLSGRAPAGEACTIQQAALYEEKLLQSGAYDRAKEYYLNLFRGAEEVPALSGDLNGPLTPGVSRNIRWEPGTLKAERVKAFCEKARISENGFFMGAMALLLGKYLNSRHVSFSTVYNGRTLAEMNGTIGTLIKRIPVYGNLSEDRETGEYLREISRQIFSTMSNDIFSFDEVLKCCPVNEDVEFIYQGDLFTDKMGCGEGDPCAAPLQGDRWFMEHYHTSMVTGCMSIQLFSTNGLYNMTIEYRNEKFTEKWVRRFAQDLFTTAESLMSAERISQVSLLTEEDRKQLKAFNDTAVPMDFVPVHEQIRRRALEHPDKPAVIADGRQLSFRDLDRLSGRLARELVSRGAGKDQLIGVLFDRDIWCYVAENAVLKAGAAFLPFIPDYPDDRIDFCMQDGACPLLLTTGRQREGRGLSENGYRILTLEEAFGTEDLNTVCPDERFDGAPSFPSAPQDLAYCIYTSGSTGRPKGVLIEHRNIANYVHRNEKSIEMMHYAAPGRVNLALASFSFDVSVVEEFVPLCNGNTVVVATETEIHDPAAFARLVRENGVNGITCTPTYLMSLLEIPESREALRQITFFDIGAEAFPRRLYDRLRELREDSVILNVYGPTECTMGCSASLMTGADQVTIGKPMANTVFCVSDLFGNELPVGLKGELIICGDQVGRGYVNLPEKSAAAFFTHDGLRAYHSGDLTAWTEDGEIRIFGRMDNQIKLRGFRIELDEIENVIAEFPGISAGAATVRKTGGAEYLAGYYTAGTKIPEEALKSFLQEKLPEYMVPNVLTQLAEMPMTVNGKIDRKALPEPDLSNLKAKYVPPETETEKKLCAAFARTLKLDINQIGLLDDFFDLGGDSLKAMEVMAGAKLDNLTAADVFRLRTPGAIAGELKKREGSSGLDARDARARLVPHNPSPLQVQVIDYQLFRPGSTMWSTMHILTRFKDADADRLCEAVNKALRNHPALATVFFFDEKCELKMQYRPESLPVVKVKDILPETEDALADILLLPFNQILNTCLCKVNVFRGRKGCYLFLDVHHAVMDGGSLGVLLGDIMNAYFGREMKKDYFFAMLEEQEERERQGLVRKDRKYFLETYGDEDWCTMLPPDDPDSRNLNEAGTSRRLAFDVDQVRAAEEYWGVSHSVMAIAAGLLTLSRMTGKQHVMINWIFNNRLAPEAENVVGMLIRNMPAAVRMEEISSMRNLLQSVKNQVAEDIAHCGWDLMSENLQPYVNDWMEVNLQLEINADELDELENERIELNNEFNAAPARLEFELIENEYGDNGFDLEVDFAEGMFDRKRIEDAKAIFGDYLEGMILRREDSLPE